MPERQIKYNGERTQKKKKRKTLQRAESAR
jgi:hypothetical protein